MLRLFHRLGNRENRHRARLKYVLRKLGEEGFRKAFAEIRAEVDAEALEELKLPSAPSRAPAPPVRTPGIDEKTPGYFAWRASAVVDQKQDGYTAVYIRLLLGDITSAQLRALGDICETFGDGSVRTTIDQNLLLPWVHRSSLPALFEALRAQDLARLHVHTARDVTSCPGADTCNLAVTASRRLGAAIGTRLEQSDVEGLAALQGTVIKISGCPNGCGQHHIAGIGFHGGAKKEGGVAYPVYQLHLGGGVDENGAFFGRNIVKIIAPRAPEAVTLLLRLYETDRLEGETPTSFYRRVDAKRVLEVLAPVLGPARPDEAFDIGETTGFQVETGEGECAA
jgi:sulfite reductase beta subunit-like hemoprotein